MPNKLDTVFLYHDITKHRPQAMASGPGYMDWASQPNPFRRYIGAPVLSLELPAAFDEHIGLKKLHSDERELQFDHLSADETRTARLNRTSLSEFFFYSLAISAWKSSMGTKWALRVNPSSGNLHPVEAYLVCGPIEGLFSDSVIAHYMPESHALEILTQIDHKHSREVLANLRASSFLVGLSFIPWRESWKYGERAYRYCHLDIGHAIATICYAGSILKWRSRCILGVGDREIASLLGLSIEGPEAEYPSALIKISTDGPFDPELSDPSSLQGIFKEATRLGQPNRLSRSHASWPLIDNIAEACENDGEGGNAAFNEAKIKTVDVKGLCDSESASRDASAITSGQRSRSALLRRLLRQRRSAQAMDGITRITKPAFLNMMISTMRAVPFGTFPWKPAVDLALLVHKVDGMDPGLYMMVRDPSRIEELKANLAGNLSWTHLEGCPTDLELYRLVRRDLRQLSRTLACGQSIASDGCFFAAMIAAFKETLQSNGAWFYPRLFWECGALGQALYLEAEAGGIRGCGIGCFFDDDIHRILGIRGHEYQCLYCFAAGGAVDDPRISTLPAYENSRPDADADFREY